MRYAVPVFGWSLAVLQHALWNGSVLLVGGIAGEDASVVNVVLFLAPLFTVSALLVLYTIARVSARRELETMRKQLAPEVAQGVLTPQEYQMLTSDELRKRALDEAKRTKGREGRDRLSRFMQASAELAFRKYHLSRGERLPPGQESPEDAYRAELALLRSQMTGRMGSLPSGAVAPG